VKHFESIRKSPKRLVYAAFDKPTFERLLVDLHIQNSNLTYWFLDPNDRSHHLKMQEESFMQALQASTRAEDVLGLLSSLRNPPPTSAEISKSNEPVYEAFHREEAAFRRRQLRLTRFKALSLTVHEEGRGEYGRASLAQSQAFSGAKASPTGAQSCSIPIESFSYVDIDSSVECPPRSAAVYKKMSVWVEWNYYQGVSENHEPPRFVEKRIDGLAKLLGDESKPAEFRIPQCLGYVHDVNHGRFGFVFKGRGTPKPLLPLSLRSLLATSKKPSLTKRMVIARTLATAMWYLHSTDWLHMGLSSENVIFNDEAEFAMSVPLLCGFEYARPAAAGEVSSPKNLHHDLYRHPDAQFDVPRNGPVGFRRTFDIYSIGVVLFEIGVWRRADLVLGLNPGNMTQAVVRNTKNKLLAAEALDLLEAETGAVFAGVVRACLLGEFGEERGGNILVEFGKQVVSRLGDIVV
jgi:serine/threonine protein kinase